MNSSEEKKLRKSIQKLIHIVKKKRATEEKQLREVVRNLINIEMKLLEASRTPDNDPVPNKSTGINVLEDLLKKIIPILETDYKLLTTAEEQRKSFRAHIISAVVAALTPATLNNDAPEAASLDEDIDIDIGDDDKFIDIRTDAEKSAEEAEEEEDPKDGFSVEGEDETGRNVAYNAFKKIEQSIVDSYDLLSNSEDQELFYDYLIANLKLYFDKFEDELTDSVEEPSNQAYDAAKEQTPQSVDDEETLDIEL